ncbi:unnamed protein product [Ambrosiozyma monospora]|uniref:Unnamed protein product n=1 Tax=Ambrosiozyma monospora TaxID=43982 RepID=A0ACB5U472_AMBMO|nr:unnamed protein product [Ambrosiozyma monospora]
MKPGSVDDASGKLTDDEDNNDEFNEISQLSQIVEPGDELQATDEDAKQFPAQMTAKHPDFLKTFFAKSRLHHLSTWKMDLRSDFLSKAVEVLRKRRVSNANSSARSHQPGQRVIMHIDFDCFFATVSALKHVPPIDINNVPVCVTNGGRSADVASCNYVARSMGCKNGMWLGKAKANCPNLVCLNLD